MVTQNLTSAAISANDFAIREWGYGWITVTFRVRTLRELVKVNDKGY